MMPSWIGNWYRKDWIFAPLVLVAEILIFYRKILFSAHYVIPWDFRYFHLNLTSFIASSLRHGQFPLWDPYTYCGVPFFANLQAQTFYPPTIITVLFANLFDRGRLIYFMELHLVAHILLGGFFTFLLLREMDLSRGAALIGGTIFQLGPYFTAHTQHLGAIDGAAWIPLACWSVVRIAKVPSLRWTGVLALSLAFSILAGFPSTTVAALLCIFTLAVLLIAFRMTTPKLLLFCGLAAVLAVALSAVQLLPAMQVSNLSVAKFRGDFRGASWGMPWQAFVSMLWPDHYHLFDLSRYKQPWNLTFLYLYCGIPALLLTVVALIRRSKYAAAFGAVMIVSFFWMMGTRTLPGRLFFPAFLDLVHDSVYVEFAMVGFSLGIAVLAAFGANTLLRKPAYSAAVLCITFLDLLLAGSGRPMNTSSVDGEPGVSYTEFSGNKELLDRMRGFINQSSPPARFDIYDDWPGWVSTATITELPTANGDDPIALYRLMQVRLLFCKGERWGRLYEVSQVDSPVLDLLNVRYLLSRTPLPVNSKYVKLAELPGRAVYENSAAMPRFFLVPNVEPAADMADAVRRMQSPAFDPKSVAIVEQGTAAHYPGGGDYAVRVVDYKPADVVLQVESAQPRYLVSSEVNYPGWRVWVDGREQPILQTNVAFRGLPLPAGSHRVVFRFRPAILLWSGCLSGFACLVLAWFLWRGQRARSTISRIA